MSEDPKSPGPKPPDPQLPGEGGPPASPPPRRPPGITDDDLYGHDRGGPPAEVPDAPSIGKTRSLAALKPKRAVGVLAF